MFATETQIMKSPIGRTAGPGGYKTTGNEYLPD